MKHTPYKCPKPCYREHCQFCEGGLVSCTVCRGAESSLPTECPMIALTDEQQRLIAAGKLDFINNEWVKKK